MAEFKWVSGAYDDGWLSIRARATLKGIKTLRLELYLPPLENWNHKHVSFKFDGVETQQVLLARGKSTVVLVEPPDSSAELTFEIVSDHREEATIDVRMLGVMCVSVGIDDFDQVPQMDILEHVGVRGVLPTSEPQNPHGRAFMSASGHRADTEGAKALRQNLDNEDAAQKTSGDLKPGLLPSIATQVLPRSDNPNARPSSARAVPTRVPPSTFRRPVVIDQRTRAMIRGWVEHTTPSGPPAVELLANGHVVDMCRASAPAPGLGSSAQARALSFDLRIPLELRNTPNVKFEVQRSDASGAVRADRAAQRRQMRVLFLANANSKTDGSRIYRSELPVQALRKIGWHASVMSEEHAREQRIDIKQATDPLDVLVFQRVPFNNFTINLCENAKASGALVLFDTDDLNFKPWRRGEMGVIRSGAIDLNDESHAESLERRMKMMLRCDGAIVSTPYLQRELLTLGVDSILSRNALEDELFAFGGRRLSQPRRDGSDLKLLFMSGSPTHARDLATIESTLHAFLVSRPDASLTLLGRVGNTHLQNLPNVHLKDSVDRKEMVRIVSQHDVALVPLERTGFNTGKSSLKFMECAAAGVPVIASPLYEFKRDITACGGGFVCSDASQWLAALNRFATDPNLSYELGEKCYRYAGANYTLSTRGTHLRDEFLRFDRSKSQTRAARVRQLIRC